MLALEKALAKIRRRYESNPWTSGPALHVSNPTHGLFFTDEPEGASHSYFIASATKPMLAVALVGQLHRAGLTVDTRVHDCLPGLLEGVPFGDTLTVRHLLSHTSGMFDYWNVHGLSAHKGPQPLAQWAAEHPGWTIDEVIDLARIYPPAAPPGKRFAYCGTNYQVATRLLEHLTGLPADRALDELVFQPAGMSDSSLFTLGDLSRFDSIAPVLLSREPYLAPRRMASLSGEGAVVSTLGDSVRFLEWVSESRDGMRGWDDMLSQTSVFAPGINYGIGVMDVGIPRVFTGLRRTPRGFGHLGMTGFALFTFPDSGWSVATTVNQMQKPLVGMRLFIDTVAELR
jgi:D-alanyl-D-alanine carboxypeptidase